MLSPSRNFGLSRQMRAKERNILTPVLDPRVERGQQQVDGEVGGENGEDHQRDDSLDRIVVEHAERLDEQVADARVVEQLLDENVSVENEAERDPERGHL